MLRSDNKLTTISARIDEDPSSFEPASFSESKSRFAMLDDVQLLANGLLQLGRGLKDFAVKTKGQMEDIFQKLNIFDQSFNVISQQTNKIKEEEEELKKTASRLQVNNEEIRNLSLQLNSKIEVLSQEKTQLQNKVGRLEETLTKLHLSQPEIQESEEVASLKNFVKQQDNHLRDLLNIVQVQHAQLGKQQEQIQDLEEKLSSPSFQESTQISSLLKEDGRKNSQRNTTVRGQDYKDNATDCTWIYNSGELSDGIYSIKPNGSKAFDVYCEMKSGEFWLGLQKIYSIVDQADYILRIELEDWRANKRYIEYTFVMGGPETDYAVRLSKITGNISNALPEEKIVKFSTRDRDNTEQRVSCPESDSGGWWYTACEETNLNGKYIKPSAKGKLEKKKKGLYWKPQKGRPYLLKSTKLMIQSTDFENFD
ncbi:hypothetical protein lerEdw1_011702 [Lerista edwardsae]|nr:hypothetical protein lerEdw1_011702 [Lerista edwardsae]